VKIILGDFIAKTGKEEMYAPMIRKQSIYDKSNEKDASHRFSSDLKSGCRQYNFCTKGFIK
jgi:hypothetical protein